VLDADVDMRRPRDPRAASASRGPKRGLSGAWGDQLAIADE
jgi:hypothetical protein